MFSGSDFVGGALRCSSVKFPVAISVININQKSITTRLKITFCVSAVGISVVMIVSVKGI